MIQPKDKVCIDCGITAPCIAGRCVRINFCYQKHQEKKHRDKLAGQKPKKRRRIKQVSDKEIKRLAQYRVLAKQKLTEQPFCEATLKGCSGIATEIHHPHSRSGENLFRDLKSICRTCHTYIHDKMSLEEGISLGLLYRKSV